MFTVRLAQLNIGIEHHFDFVERQCARFLTDNAPDFCVRAELQEIERELDNSTDEVKSTVKDGMGYSESILLFRKICLELPKYDALLFHGAAVAYAGKTYIFSAPSGTGKTTHLSLWRKAHRPELTIINGDKPIIRKMNGVFYAFGSPWAGKEGWTGTESAPMGSICFLRRGLENRIEKLSVEEAAKRAMRQILYPKNPENLMKTLTLTDELIRSCPIYLLSCTISDEAAELSFRTLTQSAEIKK